MSNQTKGGAGCSEHSTPQKTPRSTVTKTEGLSNYDTKGSRSKEENKDFSAEAIRSRILRTASILFVPPQVVELRAIFKNGRIDSGYFDDFNLLANAAASLDGHGDVSGIYWTLNPVNKDCLYRAKNHLREWTSKSKGAATTSDAEIIERRFILFDFDGTNRPAGISASDEELKAAKDKALEVVKFLAGYKWYNPIPAMSGNGYHLLYRTRLPNDKHTAEQLKKCLKTVAALYDDKTIKIDTSVFNASRICKVYGTMARKGDDTPERPHRRSALLRPTGESLDNS